MRNTRPKAFSWRALYLAALSGAVVIAGCGGSEPETSPEAASEVPAETATAAEAEPEAVPPAETEPEPATPAEETAPETATEPPGEPTASVSPGEGGLAGVAGMVKYDGTRPGRKVIRMSADPKCEALHEGARVGTVDELVSANGEVANVFVYVKSGLEGKTFEKPAQPVTLDQTGCMYEPHVMGVMVEQQVDIKNSDPLMHNVHGLGKINPEFNFGQPTPGVRSVSFRKVEPMMKVKCDVHPWMSAYIFVLDHPYFAVTDRDGKYSIPDLPPGTYTLAAAHEVYGEQETQITIPEGGGVNADFTFKR